MNVKGALWMAMSAVLALEVGRSTARESWRTVEHPVLKTALKCASTLRGSDVIPPRGIWHNAEFVLNGA